MRITVLNDAALLTSIDTVYRQSQAYRSKQMTITSTGKKQWQQQAAARSSSGGCVSLHHNGASGDNDGDEATINRWQQRIRHQQCHTAVQSSSFYSGIKNSRRKEKGEIRGCKSNWCHCGKVQQAAAAALAQQWESLQHINIAKTVAQFDE